MKKREHFLEINLIERYHVRISVLDPFYLDTNPDPVSWKKTYPTFIDICLIFFF